uniref:Aldehyde oxidase 6 n=1 Tax=Hucho hucho TaxID=62062 RepID=A0A4W5RLC2_9TELE
MHGQIQHLSSGVFKGLVLYYTWMIYHVHIEKVNATYANLPSPTSHDSANACLLPVCQLQGAAVTTVEGIGKTRVHPVQERIAKAHGSLCGFYTPGMVMSMYTLLRNKPHPTMEDITEALGGNLCRCTGYRPIIDGCKTFNVFVGIHDIDCVFQEIPPQLFDQEDLLPLDPTQDLIFPQNSYGNDPVGRPIMHRSAISQATGEAVYCDDIPKTDGELHLVLVTSTRPHAKILDIDISEALQVPGVVDVITSKDIPGKKFRTFMYVSVPQVSCMGHMVCAVVADTRKQAKRGAAVVKIGNEDLPGPVFTVEKAIEKQSFFLPQRMIERGNVDEAFDKVDHIYEGEIRLGGQEHFYMETQIMVVVPSGEGAQSLFLLSTPNLCPGTVNSTPSISIPEDKKISNMSCHVKRVGGAFGGKVTNVCHRLTGRPVCCVWERGEDILITGARHPVLGKHKVGFMNDGRIMAADLHYYANSGNTTDESLLVIEKILLHLDNAYNMPNLRGRSVACKTNLPSNTAFRGFGVLQSIWSPWDECKEKSDYGSRRKSIAQFNQQNRWKKRGMATIPIKYGIAFSGGFLIQVSFALQAASLVHIHKDGSVLVSHGGTEMGQGIHTKMQQVGTILSHLTNTSAGPNTCPSAASFGTDANDMAVKVQYCLGSSQGHDLHMDWEKQEGQPYAYYTYGARCSKVEVDCLTGDYRTVRTDIVMDIGRSINPSVDISQIEGAFIQGLGLYNMEFSPSGVLYTRGPSQYKIPAGVCDQPLTKSSLQGIGEPVLFMGSFVFFVIKDVVAAACVEAGMVGPFTLDSPATPERTCLASNTF